MPGTASVLLTPEVVRYLMDERSDELVIHAFTDFGDGLMQTLLEHPRLRDGHNGQTELFFVPFPHGEIHFRRETDT